jgi:hypothetical protein
MDVVYTVFIPKHSTDHQYSKRDGGFHFLAYSAALTSA